MKKTVQVVVAQGEDLLGLLGQRIILNTQDYFITGELSGVNDLEIQLTNPAIVYDTGRWSAKSWADTQALPCKTMNVRLSAVQWYFQTDK